MTTKKISSVERMADSVMSALRGFVDAAEKRILGAVEKRFEVFHDQPRTEEVKRWISEAQKDVRDGEDGKPGPQGDPGPKGDPGPVVPAEDVAKLVLPEVVKLAEEKITAAVAELPSAEQLKGERGQQGEPGPAGQSVAVDDVVAAALPVLREHVDKVAADRIPAAELLKGATGERGERGEQGIQGEKGERGETGEKGEKGDIGPAGPAGERGEKGDAGERGERGEKGEIGEAGKSVAVAEVVEVVLADVKQAALAAVAEIPPAEPDVDAIVERLMPALREHVAALAKDIPAGKDGRDGVDGKSVEIEQVVALVEQAFAKADKPRDGRDGQDGAPGRDAVHVDILPALDEKRAYPRSTYAQHKGGLWRSHKTTEGLVGWDCIVRGVDALEISQVEGDPRTFVMTTTLSDGTTAEKTVRIPAVIDRGVFKEGQEYRQGDSVTWARHMWIARVDTKAKPDYAEGNDWRLAVKGGRDGNHGKDGEPGPQGPQGVPGRIIGGLPQ